MKKLLAILLVVMLSLTLAACGDSAAQKAEEELQKAKDAYGHAVESFNNAQENLPKVIFKAEVVLEEVSEDEVADPAVLKNLTTALADAKAATELTTPDMADETEKITEQTSAILEQNNEINSLSNKLSHAIADVEASQQSLQDKKQREAVEAKEVYVGTTATIDGYKAEFTVNMTKWLKASDTEALQKAWEGVGGQDSYPSISNFSKYTNDGFNETSAVVAFGNMSFRNITEGFDITENNQVAFGVSLDSDSYAPKIYVKYASTSFLQYLRDIGTGITPLMEKNTWGPVPFMIVYPGVFTPNYPNGDPELNDFKLYFGSRYGNEYATIEPSWE